MSCGVSDRVAGNSEWFVAGCCGCCVLDLSGQVLDPVQQVLLVGAHHLETLKHCACRKRDDGVGRPMWDSFHSRLFFVLLTIELKSMFMGITVF